MNSTFQTSLVPSPSPFKLIVDGFKTFQHWYGKQDCVWILSHYHGDHYGGLPRDWAAADVTVSVSSPSSSSSSSSCPIISGLIHCTPITKRLLIRIHGVPADRIVSHEYGEEWDVCDGGDDWIQSRKSKPKKDNNTTFVTFFDAHHCPGAAVMLFRHTKRQEKEGKEGKEEKEVFDLHTGDMRYSPPPAWTGIEKKIFDCKIETVFADTTYGNEKFTFPSQEESVTAIGRITKTIVNSADYEDDTLILIGAYNIGKEKAILAAASNLGEKGRIFVQPRKRVMLECCADSRGDSRDDSRGEGNVATKLLRHVSRDKSSPIHVVGMDLAGRVFPFFLPDYRGCADYARETGRRWKRVCAIIPTGWAGVGKWNKANSKNVEIVARQMKRSGDNMVKTKVEGDDIEVSIHLIPYSEHSSFGELHSFLKRIKPANIVPIVFKNENDQRRILERFRGCTDEGEAIKGFFRNMGGEKAKAKKKKKRTLEGEEEEEGATVEGEGKFERSEDEREVKIAKKSALDDKESKRMHTLATLLEMGFEIQRAVNASHGCNGNLQRAIEMLFAENTVKTTTTEATMTTTTKTAATRMTTTTNGTPTTIATAKRKKTAVMTSPNENITKIFPKK